MNTDVKVVGIGGAGANVVEYMLNNGFEAAGCVLVNTGGKALARAGCRSKVRIGPEMGPDENSVSISAELGRRYARESCAAIAAALHGARMVILVAGLGGGAGTGAAPVVGHIAREMGMLVVAVVSTPLPFEGKCRAKAAKEGLEMLLVDTDSMLVFPTEHLIAKSDKRATMDTAMMAANDILARSTESLVALAGGANMTGTALEDLQPLLQSAGPVHYATPKSADAGENVSLIAALADELEALSTAQPGTGVLLQITVPADFTIADLARLAAACEAADGTRKAAWAASLGPAGEIHLAVLAPGLANTVRQTEKYDILTEIPKPRPVYVVNDPPPVDPTDADDDSLHFKEVFDIFFRD